MSTENEQQQRFRRTLLIAAVLYTVFVIYGSLVPLNYVPMPLSEAWTQFAHIRYLNLGVRQRADWVANILLYIPLTLLWYGTLTTGSRHSGRRFIAMGLVLSAGIVLGVAIEFVQLFFPPRTVSLNDVFAQSLGTGIGIAAWRPSQKLLMDLHSLFFDRNDKATTVRIVLIVYLLVLAAYNLMPLDLTISFAEIYHKWNQGRILLNPFHLDSGGLIKNIYAIATDAMIWIPPSIALALEFKYRTLKILALMLAAIVGLELLQLIVYSRVSDARDIVSGFAGAIVGLALARYTPLNRYSHTAQTESRKPGPARQRSLWPVPVACAWYLSMLAVFWYPYNFVFEPSLIANHLKNTSLVPFTSYYFGTEFNAVTELLHKVVFFIPLGALFGAMRLPFYPAFCLALGGATIIEFGQLFMPGEVIDPGDLIFAAIGSVLGYKLLQLFLPALAPPHANRSGVTTVISNHEPPTQISEPLTSSSQKESTHPYIKNIALTYLPFIAALGLLATVISKSGVLPYNVRELFPPGRAGLTGALLAGVILVLAATPIVSTSRLLKINPLPSIFNYLGTLIGAGILAWLLLWSAVPVESLHDILGSPVLNWPWHFELLGRFLSLFVFYTVISTAGILRQQIATQRYQRRHHYVLRWLLCAVLALPLCHWISVTNASTDNLTELMRGGGSWFSSTIIGAWILLVASSVNGLISGLHKHGNHLLLAVVLAVVSIPLGYGLLNLGLEAHVVKYGNTFSALQFLLSIDRTHLATGNELFLRFSLAQGLWMGALFMLTLPLRPRPMPLVSPIKAHHRSGAMDTRVEHRMRSAPNPDGNGGYRGIRLSQEQFAYINELAKQLSLSVTETIQRIIEQDLLLAKSTTKPNAVIPDATDHSDELRAWDIWLPTSLLKELNACSDQAGISVSRFVRSAVARSILARQNQ